MSKKTLFFIVAVAVQVGIVAMIPAKKIVPLLTGRQITIRTMPVDPYDFLSGYHVVLNYEISRLPQDSPYFNDGQKVYLVLIEGPQEIWYSLSAYVKWPQDIPDGAVVMCGKKQGSNRCQFGIESFFVPEKDRSRIERDLRENAGKALADIKVDRSGNVVLLRLRIADRVYDY